MVDDEGRARVLDFGLARRTDEVDEDTSILEAGPGTENGTSRFLWTYPLTKTGAVLGTPRLHAARADDGIEADVRSDQFSFCVALYEAALWRAPFRGQDGWKRLMVTMLTPGEVRPPPKGSPVPPAKLRAVLLRGLAYRPEPCVGPRWKPCSSNCSALLAAHRFAATPGIGDRSVRWPMTAIAGFVVLRQSDALTEKDEVINAQVRDDRRTGRSQTESAGGRR